MGSERTWFWSEGAARPSYAVRISRLDSTRSIRGRMPSSVEIARERES